MNCARPIAAIVVLLAGVARLAALEGMEQLQFADGVYARGMWDIAVKEYQEYLAQNPGAPQAAAVCYRIAECYRGLGNTAEADKAYVRVYTEFPGTEYRFRAGLRRAELLDQAQQPDEQRRLLRAMLTDRPPVELAAACQYALGASHQKAGQAAEAAKAFEAVLAQYQATPFASYAALALAAVRAQTPGGVPRALELYQVAASNPASPRVGAEAWFQLGELSFREKQYELSARAYAALFQKYPADERIPAARLAMAWACHNAGLYADALRQSMAVLAAGAVQTQGKEAEWLYLKANSERQLLQYREAIRTYGELLQKFPADPFASSAAYERALASYRMGSYADAIEQARALNLTPPIKKDAYWLLAESYAALKDDANAIQYYRLLVDQFPQADLAGDAMYRLAHLLQKKGDTMQAADMFGHLAQAMPRHALAPQALFASAACLSRLKKHEDAVRDWTLLLQKYPASPLVEESLYQKAMSETYLRRDALALTTWRDLLQRYPATRFAADAHFWSGVLLEEGGRLDEAEAALRRAAAAQPSDELGLRIRFRTALVLQRRGQMDEAAGLFQGLITSPLRAQFSPDLLEWLADYHLGREEYAPASSAAALLVQRADTDAWRQIGWCLQGKGRLGEKRAEEARQAFEQAVAIAVKTPAAAESHLHLGDLALAAGDPARARPRYEQAAALASTDAQLGVRVQAYAGLARTLKAQGDWAGAARHFLSVGILFDDPILVPECLHEAAEALQKAGKPDERRKVIDELIQRYPDSVWARKYKP